MNKERMIELAKKAGWEYADDDRGFEPLWDFAELVRADERVRVTNLLLYMHNKAAPYHNYYKHAAVELNRKAGEGELI
jgi:hypothetical protein